MKLEAFARFLQQKINSAHRKAKNPFMDPTFTYNPFSKPIYTTIVWIEPEEEIKNTFRK